MYAGFRIVRKKKAQHLVMSRRAKRIVCKQKVGASSRALCNGCIFLTTTMFRDLDWSKIDLSGWSLHHQFIIWVLTASGANRYYMIFSEWETSCFICAQYVQNNIWCWFSKDLFSEWRLISIWCIFCMWNNLPPILTKPVRKWRTVDEASIQNKIMQLVVINEWVVIPLRIRRTIQWD